MINLFISLAARRTTTNDLFDVMTAEEKLYMFIGITAVCAVIAIVWCVSKTIKAKRMNNNAINQYNAWLESVKKAGGELPHRTAPFKLQEDECCLYADPTAVLYEPRSVNSSGYGGTSFDVAQGVTIHGGRIESTSHKEMAPQDSDGLYITNKRIVFRGSTANRTFELTKISAIGAAASQVRLDIEGVDHPVLFGSINGLIFNAVTRSLMEAAKA